MFACVFMYVSMLSNINWKIGLIIGYNCWKSINSLWIFWTTYSILKNLIKYFYSWINRQETLILNSNSIDKGVWILFDDILKFLNITQNN